MKQRRTPQEKKALVYTRDTRVSTEYPHTFRRAWPRKKAQAHRAYRRTVHQLLRHTDRPDPCSDEAGPVQVGAVRRRQVRKWDQGRHGSAVPLRTWIAGQHELRIVRTAHNYFKEPYQQAVHGARFAAFLSTLLAGTTTMSRQYAVLFNELLPHPQSHPWPTPPWGWRDQERAWFAAFLRDYPTWEQRLQQWIAERFAAL